MIVKTPLNLPSTKTDVNSKDFFLYFIKKPVRGGKGKFNPNSNYFYFLYFAVYFFILNQC